MHRRVEKRYHNCRIYIDVNDFWKEDNDNNRG